MRSLIILLLLCGTASATPFIKCDCNGQLVINGSSYDCPPSIDAGSLPNGLTKFSVISGSLRIDFYVDKSENSNFEFYNMIYDKINKEYFDKFNTSIKIKK